MRLRSLLAGVCLGPLVLAGFSPAHAQLRGLGARPPTPEEQAYINAVYTEVEFIAPNDLAIEREWVEMRQRVRRGEPALPLDGLPAAVDNSTSQNFPPIGGQGAQGSCTAWAGCYYYDTYTQAMDEGYDVSGGDLDHICSPAFMYPLVNGGVDLGASTQYVVARLNDVGCSSWTLKPYSASDWTSWPSEAAWVDAMQNRTQASFSITASTSGGLTALKQHLANGNLAVTSFSVYRTFYEDPSLADATGINNRVYYAIDGDYLAGHAVTLVGYDDSRPYLDHRDGQTHYGAFLLANSWGSGWGVVNSSGSGSKGFFWVAYDMFLSSTFGPTAYYNSDRDNYRARLYVAAGVNHAQRYRVGVRAGVSTSPGWASYYAVDYQGGSSFSVSDADRIAVDITDGCSLIGTDPVEVFAQLRVHASAGTSGTITSADFYEDLDEDGVYWLTSSADPTVTVNAGTSGYAYAIIQAQHWPMPKVVLEDHPNERAPGVASSTLLGKTPWVNPVVAPTAAYWWQTYRFAGSGALWVQVCAQNFSGAQNVYGDGDDMRLTIDGVVPNDYDGIQKGALGGYQWNGNVEKGERWTLRFLALNQGGLHNLRLSADQAPILWWVKVTDLEPATIYPD